MSGRRRLIIGPIVEPRADGRYQWDKLSAGPDKHQRFRRPASEARRSRAKDQSTIGHISFLFHELAGQFMKQGLCPIFTRNLKSRDSYMKHYIEYTWESKTRCIKDSFSYPEIGTTWNTVTKTKKHSDPCVLASFRSLINLGPRIQKDLIKEDTTLLHRKLRRATSIVSPSLYFRKRSKTVPTKKCLSSHIRASGLSVIRTASGK